MGLRGTNTEKETFLIKYYDVYLEDTPNIRKIDRYTLVCNDYYVIADLNSSENATYYGSFNIPK